MAAGPFVGAAILGSIHAETAVASAGLLGTPLGDRPRPGLALGLLPQRPDRADRPRPRLGGQQRLGDAPDRCPGRPPRSDRLHGRAGGGPGRADPPGEPLGRRDPRAAGDDGPGPPLRRGRGRPHPGRGRRSPSARSVPAGPAVRLGRVRLGRPRLAPHRVRLRDRDHRGGGVRGPGALRRATRAAGRPRCARRGHRGRGPRLRVRRPAALAPAGHRRRPRGERRRPVRHGRLVADDRDRGRGSGPRALSAWASA